MENHVPLQTAILRESFVTHLTLKRFLPGVCLQVARQVCLGFEDLPADMTAVRH
ncbi:hypothetical protein DPMN_021595 [Dreissena polymorpha]|uniref:Uncharacterized protein n=1 Tax=Dreissena polymorpha TaxID=45954 RepID=A0A9D4SBW3_DREPO|nr:hypothetical protein DPMN_021595 [Dreissena polymorpha]